MHILGALLGLICLAAITLEINSAFAFDNVRCMVNDVKIMEFDYCYLRSINRTYKYISIKTKYHKLPITTALATLSILLRENRSVLYNFNINIDGCKFMRDRDNAIANWMLGSIGSYTDINHTCPYTKDITVEKLPVHHVTQWIKYVLPDGRYYFNSSWVLNGKKACQVLVYFTVY